jgi:cytochrome c oxidase subunit 1
MGRPHPRVVYSFAYVPVVTELDDFWYKKYQPDENGKLRKIADGNDIAQKGDQHPHLPSPSYWPIVLAAGFPLIALGIIYNLWLAGFGLVFLLAAMYGWSLEPATDPDAGHGHDDHGDDDPSDGGDDAAAAAETDTAETLEAPVG